MPIDINHFRESKGGNINKLKDLQKKRFYDQNLIDQIKSLDENCRKTTFKLDKEHQNFSKLSKEIATLKKKKANAEDLIKELKSLKLTIKDLDKKIKTLLDKRSIELNKIGNFLHDSVPISKDEKDNKLIRKYGNITSIPCTPLQHHHEILYRIGGYEPEKGAKVAGHRGYFLTGPGVILNMALQNYSMNFLTNKYDYQSVQPPYFMNKNVMSETCQLSQFDEELYHITTENSETKYLIATSEQPLSAIHRNEWIDTKKLPIKYAGISTCFRKEAGAHGKDAWGIFRVHQFEKIEQFVITAPSKSWEMHSEMIKISEEFYKTLNLPYRIVSIISGELNNSASMKYDLEGWFPTLKRYKELVSCSNCTDYQSRAMEIRYGFNSNKKANSVKEYVHMLNSTLCATTRTICCILENYQREDGVVVPDVLQPYCGGKKFFPFIRNKLDIKMKTSKNMLNKKINKEKNKNES